MEGTRERNIREAIKKYGPITDRFILRLGKSEEEAGKFESWHSNPNTFEEDFQGFLACLRLTRLVDSVEERMKGQKSTIRAVKKEQRETAKSIKKEQEKLQKALDKAAAKVEKEAEKTRIKVEAKAERERLKANKKAGIVCMSTLKPNEETSGPLASMALSTPLNLSEAMTGSVQNLTTVAPETPQPESTTLTVAQGPRLVSSMFESEEEVTPSPYKLPME
jgi:hypothetical protein